jgi:hypothetical protein|tara:strand:+ start:1270 stop:3285 length:2016 start_codon:yes stop_codon:yes gene_type:complete
MKDNIISINLETATAPIIQEVRGRDYIEYGTEDWRNLYPQFLIDLYYNSSTHAAIINATSEMIAAEDLVVSDDDTSLDAYVKLKKFMRHANSKESLHQVIKKVAFDFKLQGAYALHVVWNRERTEIAEIYHVPVERVRAGRPNEMGKVDTYFISADWSNVRTHKPYPIAAFNVNDRTSGSQLIYTGRYSPNMDIYHAPDYNCQNWALVDQRVAEFHLNNIENGFSGSYFISFANGIPTAEERRQIEQSLADKFTGAKNSGKFILTFSDDKTRTPEITPISVSDADKQYLALQELLVQNILTGHRVTSPMLMGIKNDTGLGSNVDELNAAFNFFLNTVIIPFQLHIKNTLQTIFSVNDMDLPVEFVQLKPITLDFTSEDLKGVMTEDEIREELGLKPLDVEVREDFSKVGMIDGQPVFDTIEEAVAVAEKKGCEGYHEHELDGKTVYMPCEGHSAATELSKFIEEFGEDIPEGYELVEEEKVEDEHLDFNFEEVLNDAANERIEFASTGSPKPSRKSEQDGISKKTYDYFRVRYVYAEDNFLVNKTGQKRRFCRQMMGANKLYRKEDIQAMSNKVVNDYYYSKRQKRNIGWGPNGALKYDILKFKGGGNCQHFWLRQIFKTTIGESRTTKIEDADLIGYTKARSEGFTAKKNSPLVAKPPKRMKNKGFLKPR